MARRAAGDFLSGVYELPGGGFDAGEITLDAAEHDDYLWVDATNVDGIKTSEAMYKCVKDALVAAQQAG